jgi:nucleoside 2-deoxyribosyltransferase
MRIYLAGPDVFLPEPGARASALKAVCARHGVQGVSPLDALADEPGAWSVLPEARRIALRNEAHIRACDALIANLTPFRGPSADVGTVFEVGFARALGLRLFGWSNDARGFAARTRSLAGLAAAATHDADGLLIEDFDMADNLMIESAILASGGRLIRTDMPPSACWADLAAFEACVSDLASVR